MNYCSFVKNTIQLLIVIFIVNHLAFAQNHDDTILNITAPELNMLMQKNSIVLINSMSIIEYDRQHIPNSISIPLNDMYTTKKLPEQKDKPIAFYCMGTR